MTPAFAGSNPASPVDIFRFGIVAQAVEHLTFNQVVEGSSPSSLISSKIAENLDFKGFPLFLCRYINTSKYLKIYQNVGSILVKWFNFGSAILPAFYHCFAIIFLHAKFPDRIQLFFRLIQMRIYFHHHLYRVTHQL